MGPRPDLPPFPNGWFVFGFSDELKPGKLLARPFMGCEVTVFRAQSGQAYAVDSYCPHLGAHFGSGGEVRGENLECGFHGFQFNGQGTCVRTGYGIPIPARAKLRTWPLRETDGLLLVHHHAKGEAPAWEVPSVGADGWTRLIHRSFVLDDHPQRTTENSVDLGHFAFGHKYRNPHMLRALKEFEANGPHLSTVYAVRRALRIFGLELTEYDFELETQIYGLGYSLVDVRVPLFRVTARLWVLPTSIDAERMTLRLALRVKKWDSALGAFASSLVARAILSGFVHDVGQDFPLWEHKHYTESPALGDGLAGKYRQWAKQFYR